MASRVTIYTDGACKGNPGPGGWGAVLILGDSEKEMFGGESPTTNNRMELTAVIKALGALKRACSVDLYTDSQYVRQGLTQWMPGWIRKNWKTAGGDPVKNRELWERLHASTLRHQIDWRWVMGHSGDPDNERVDTLARNAAIQIRDASPVN
jgi:ribonuclease HI